MGEEVKVQPPVEAGHVAQANPLSEASPTSLEELFSRDPAGYQKQDLEAVVKELRRMAAKWKVEEASGASKSASGKKSASAVLKQQVNDLGDLGL